MSIKYSKAPVPSSPEDLSAYLQSELDRISAVINNIAEGHFDASFVEPTKLRAGDIKYADGTSWNPGSGEGLYIYFSNGNWSKLGTATGTTWADF